MCILFFITFLIHWLFDVNVYSIMYETWEDITQRESYMQILKPVTVHGYIGTARSFIAGTGTPSESSPQFSAVMIIQSGSFDDLVQCSSLSAPGVGY